MNFFPDEYEDDEIPQYVPRTPEDDYSDEIRKQIMDKGIHESIGRLEKLTADSSYYRISLYGICSSVPLSKHHITVSRLFDLLVCLFDGLPPYGATLDVLDCVPSEYDKDLRFAKDDGNYLFVKASSQEEAESKEQAIRDLVIGLDKMMELFGAEYFNDTELELMELRLNEENHGTKK